MLEIALGVGLMDLDCPLLTALRVRLCRFFGLPSGKQRQQQQNTPTFRLAQDLALTYSTALVHKLQNEHLLPVSSRTIRRYFIPPQATDGVNPTILENFLRVARQTCTGIVEKTGDNSFAIPVCLAVDGMALGSSVGYDPYSDIICGVKPIISPLDLEFDIDKPDTIRKWAQQAILVSSAHLHIITSLDAKVSKTNLPPNTHLISATNKCCCFCFLSN